MSESESLDVKLFFQNTALLSIGSLALTGNLLIICIVLKYPSLRKAEDTLQLIAFLAAADGINGGGIMTTAALRYRYQFQNIVNYTRGECLASSSPLIFGMYSGQTMLLFVILDRLSAVCNPMKYLTKNHLRFAVRCFIFTMVYSAISVAAMFHGDLNAHPAVCNAGSSLTMAYRIYWSMFSFGVAGGVISLYAAVLLVLKKQVDENECNGSIMAAQICRQAHITRVVSLIIVVYCVLWVTPNTVFNTAGLLGFKGDITGFLGPFIPIGAVTSSALNILIYSWKMPSFRTYFKKFSKWESDNVVGPNQYCARALNYQGTGTVPTARGPRVSNVTFEL